MHSTIKTRLTKLEAHYLEPENHPTIVLITVVENRNGKPATMPIAGWAFNDRGITKNIWRAPNETDQQLEQRAKELARLLIKPKAVPFLFQLTEEDLKCEAKAKLI